MIQLMPAAYVAYLLPFWPIHWPALAIHTSTSSSPIAGKAFAYSLYGVITPPKEHLLREEQRQLDTITVTILVKNYPGQK
jgi:hypothetical protein